jgi:membrane protease YdiL (CAAX protease family)
MSREPDRLPTFWGTVWLLLAAARKRSAGRRRRQRELLNSRSGKTVTDWNWVGVAVSLFFMLLLNGAAAFAVHMAVDAGQRAGAERQGKIVVSGWFLRSIDRERSGSGDSAYADSALERSYSSEARSIAERYGGNRKEIEERLRAEVRDHGGANFIAGNVAAPGIKGLEETGPLPAMLGSLGLIWWVLMLVFQGEGLELDLQRRRHPMWEWLFSHPAPPGAIFLAEMLSPLAANAVYWGAPVFAGAVYWSAYGPGLAALALVLVGAPVSVAAACAGKALEIGVVLRFSPRTRGAIMGIISWAGYASMMMLLVGVVAIPRIATAAARYLSFLAALPWPWLRWFLGGRPDGSFSFLAGVAFCWVASIAAIAGAVAFSLWGAQQGLSGNFASTGLGRPAVKTGRTGKTRFGREPLYRKEFLWFTRDRSAIVQAVLIPITAAGFQAFNLQRAFRYAQGSWNALCGAAILFGTYFLWILGPKSLTSEGSALWIALTWPRGLENLLKAKAWLWSLLSSGIVILVLAYDCVLYPPQIWKILLVGAAWYIFARSMAEKSVTLVRITSESGETAKIPAGRRWATQLGMLTFAIGVFSQQWHIAVMGIVYSYVTAAAMWQNFRARLPYLYDPWSERVPPPPTLMHAMIAISVLVEGGAVVAGILSIFLGKDNLAVARAIGYCSCAVVVSVATARFLRNRGVPPGDVWQWRQESIADETPEPWWKRAGLGDARLYTMILVAACGGLVLGMAARGYQVLLENLPATAELIRKSQEQMADIPNLRASYAIMAVLFAPFAEEYLFRGLLFRALDREWGGWRAVAGSAAFFAVYHPPLSWVPVALLGAANALLFKKTGRLAPAVVLHMVYNAAVLM